MTSSEQPVVDKCPNCGAPLQLDPGGLCHWCRAHVRLSAPPARPSADDAELLSLGPDQAANPFEGEPEDVMLILPAMSILASLSMMSYEQAVKSWLAGWEMTPQVGDLLQAMRAAATRAQLVGLQQGNFNEFSDWNRYYTDEEWWVFRLALDLQAMVAGLPGMPPLTAAKEAASARDQLQGSAHHFKRAMKAAGAGPEGLQALRAAVPPLPL